MAPPRAQPSPPFVSREFNGEVLLDELADLRAAQVHSRHLVDCLGALRGLDGVRVSEVATRLRALAGHRFTSQPALASLLVRWAARLKNEIEVPLLVSHFERLVLTSLLVTALQRGAERLPRSGR
jgi:hypothetical protein